MPTQLDQILSRTLLTVLDRKEVANLPQMERRAAAHTPRGFAASLRSTAVKIPVLRKDFILDPFQILEARAAGADAVLLIVAAHDDETLRDLNNAARRMGLDVLCEVHDQEELRRAVDLGCQVIGVNCRDLKTLQVDLRLHEEIVRYMPTNVLRVAESGIRTPTDVERLLGAGYDAFLVGEALMRQPEPAATLALLMGKDYASEF